MTTQTFDSLGYAKRLREAGIDREHAEAHAEAARDFVMADLVTKSYLDAALRNLQLTVTVSLGGMMVVAVGVVLAVMKL